MVVKFSRSQRRHHYVRLIKKRYKEVCRYLYNPDDSDYASALVRARIRVTTAKRCSCAMCGNPRHAHGGNRWVVKTRQEYIADLKAMDQE